MSTSSTPGNAPDGRTDRTWECARADGQAMPSQRSASAAGARWQQSPSGQRDRVRRVASRPRNQREWSNGTPSVIAYAVLADTWSPALGSTWATQK
jgi:hypothetical protein